jgi:molecular chaperone Hsp33
MIDHLVRGILEPQGLRVVFVRVTELSRLARMLHGLYPTSAYLFGEALAAGLLLGALQKEKTRVNFQVLCDGPGFFVDADADGNVRGYVRQPEVGFSGDPRQGARAALGGAGTLSVLRDIGAEGYYRGSVPLEAFELARDLGRYFAESEQVQSAVDIAVLKQGDEPLGEVAGLLVQKLPDGDAAALGRIGSGLAGGALAAALEQSASAHDVITACCGPGFELLADTPVSYLCTCSAARARTAVSALGPEGIDDVLANEKKVEITCEFCKKRYLLDAAALEKLKADLLAQAKGEG